MHKSLKYTFYGIIVIFLFLFFATYHTLKIAFTNNEGVMNKDYYEVGLNYEKFIDAQKKLIEEGYHFESQIISENPKLKKGENNIEIKFLRESQNISGAEVELKIEKRATDKFTKIIKLQDNNGIYSGKIFPETGGKWFLTITGNDHGKILKKYFPVDVIN